jgi:hypothetical protein
MKLPALTQSSSRALAGSPDAASREVGSGLRPLSATICGPVGYCGRWNCPTGYVCGPCQFQQGQWRGSCGVM